jgi:drug/metabolite transporter (DMT)-like permease
MLWYSGVARVPGHLAAGFMVVMPVSALLLSYLLLGERFEWMHLAGFGLAFAGVVLMTWEHYRQAKAAA